MSRLIAFTLRERWLMIVLLVAVLGVGYASYRALNIEAYPDPVPPLVDIVTLSNGQSAEEIERYITIPIEIQLAGIPHVTAVRTISLFGLSDVKVQFTYDFSYDDAEQRVINRLTQLSPLPNGAVPQVSPESPTGEIYRYRVVGPPGYSVTDLKTLEDWVLERRFKAVPGVIDVTGWGGKTKTYEIVVDNAKLLASGVTLAQVLQAIGNSNINVGGQTVNFGEEAAIVRGVGLIRSLDALRTTMIANLNGAAVFIGDVATVQVGHQPRLGIAGQDGDDDIVQGIVLMRRGAQSLPTLRGVETEVDKINRSGILPPGVRVERIYDRSDLIGVTTNTVLHNLLYGILLIFVLQWLFLGKLRSAIIVSLTIPFALAFAILMLVVTGQSANLLSIGAIDFGLVVDATVIMVENIFRHILEARTMPRETAILKGANEVTRAILFSAAIIIASFIPLFTLSGIEGHIFGPMAKTYAYAIAGGLIATFTISPALTAILMHTRLFEVETFAVKALQKVYRPLVGFALSQRPVVLGGTALAVVLAVSAGHTLGLEFLPHLEEGNFWIRATMPQTVSLEGSNDYVNQMRAVMRRFPEVVTVISQHGRPDDGTDATGFFNA
ncbi:MAG: efflux RND transporter permease subunit, partial [Candidatus Eremiobacteraeota bacterium]|nr:efflux RND transporter permease subunit [Candidatus Eremiobacteraeota bacterium]